MREINTEIEYMPREELKRLQGERLARQVKRCYENVECFRLRMDEAGLVPDDIRGIEDISKLPFSYKKDLRDYYPYGLFAVPLTDVARVHASSGTTGKRIVVGYTEGGVPGERVGAICHPNEDWFKREYGGKLPAWEEIEKVAIKRAQEKCAELADYKRVRKVVVSKEPLVRTSIGKVKRVTYKETLDE